jgi:hypothetical protein
MNAAPTIATLRLSIWTPFSRKAMMMSATVEIVHMTRIRFIACQVLGRCPVFFIPNLQKSKNDTPSIRKENVRMTITHYAQKNYIPIMPFPC